MARSRNEIKERRKAKLDVVRVSLHEVPEARELAYVQQARSGNWLERAQVNLLAHRLRHEAIARTERKRLIRHGQPIQIGSHRGRIDKAGGEHRQAELDSARFSGDFGLHHLRVNHVSPAEPADDEDGRHNQDQGA